MADSAAGTAELTSYVGRADAGEEVRRLLGEYRLVTLTGPGGVGKTRLAGRAASAFTRAFPDGVAIVPLGELQDASLLAQAVADGLGLHDTADRSAQDAVLAYLREQQLLLLLDNCEHLVDGCAAFAAMLLRRCSNLVILATSRCSLDIAGECVLPIGPLAVPGDDVAGPDEALASDAVRLFADRASAVVPSFRLTESNTRDVASVCRQLDGLPLAIELAAARLRTLSPRQIAERLGASLTLLTGGARTLPDRHRTLRATVEWSYSLCDGGERAVWERCSVFAGPFDLSAAEELAETRGAGDGPALDRAAVLDAVDGLVGKSVLMRVDGETRMRYRMLHVLREFGQERLAASGTSELFARRHRDHHDRLLDQAGDEWFGPGQDDWLARLSESHADIRAALSWSLRTSEDALVALRMSTCLVEYWAARGAARELREWIDRSLSAVAPDAPGRARGQAIAALCAALHADVPRARQRLDLAAAAEGDDAAPFVAHAEAFVAMLVVEPGVLEHAAEAVRTFGERGDPRRQMHPMFLQGIAMAYRGDLAGARDLLGRMRGMCAEAGDKRYRSMALFGLGVVEVWLGGDLDAGERALREALHIDLQGPDVLSAAYRVDGLAWVAAKRGDALRAAGLFGTAAALWERCGSEPDVAVAMPHREMVKATRDALSDADFDTAFAAGKQRNPRHILAAADPTRPEPGPASSGRPPALVPLTRRESEIARLVAAGLSNREIAARLVIAQRTAETHLQHIMNKLDLGNRTQVAIWVNAKRS